MIDRWAYRERLHANPAELVATAGAYHVIASSVLIDVHPALRALASLMFLLPLFVSFADIALFSQPFQVLLARHVLVPLNSPSKTSLCVPRNLMPSPIRYAELIVKG